LVHEQQRVERWNLEFLAARLAHDFVVHANQMVAQLRKLRAVSLISTGRQPILFDAPHPPDGVLVCAVTSRTRIPRGALFRFVGEEGPFVEGHPPIVSGDRYQVSDIRNYANSAS